MKIDALQSQLSWSVREELKLEEDYCKTRSWADRLLEGDRSTTFFHRKASQWHKQNIIAKITDANGVTHEDPMGMELSVLNYFHPIYTPNNSDLVLQEGMIDRILGMNEISYLEKPLTADEVFLALKHMKDRKRLVLLAYRHVFCISTSTF